MHDDLVRVSWITESVLPSRHENARVTSSYVMIAGIVQREIQTGVQNTLDRSLHPHVQLPVSQIFDFPRENVIRLTDFPHERGVVSNGGG